MKFRTLIVDDEELARERIRMLLEGDPEIEVVGECADGVEAVQAILIRRAMKDLAGKLDPSQFLRIHRSAIVNLDVIRELHPLFHGEYSIRLEDGTSLTSNRSCKKELQRLLGDKL